MFVFSSLFGPIIHPSYLSLSLFVSHIRVYLIIYFRLSHPHTRHSGAADLLTKNGESIHFSQLLPHDAGGNMKTVKHPKTTTINVGDGPPRVVPLDKEDEYAMGMILSSFSSHTSLFCLILSYLLLSPLIFYYFLISYFLSCNRFLFSSMS